MNTHSHPEPEERERAEAPPAPTPPIADPTSLKATLIAARDQDELSNARLSRRLGISAATLSQYLSGQYPGDVPKIEKRIADWLRTRERLRKGGVRLIDCPESRTVAAALETIRRTNDVGLIHGDAGVGKTSGITLYTADNTTTIMITLERWARSDRGVESLIWGAIEHRGWKSDCTRGEYIVQRLRGSSRLLIVDNAHKATAAGIEYLFDLHDETGIPIALVGNPEVLRHIESNDQRFSRIGLMQPVELKGAETMIAHIIQQLAPRFLGKVEHLAEQVVENRGCYRGVVKHTSLALTIAEAGGMAPDAAFRAAHKRLVCDYQLN